jgi:hypothetical protein
VRVGDQAGVDDPVDLKALARVILARIQRLRERALEHVDRRRRAARATAAAAGARVRAATAAAAARALRARPAGRDDQRGDRHQQNYRRVVLC